jgi:hypothetical protein
MYTHPMWLKFELAADVGRLVVPCAPTITVTRPLLICQLGVCLPGTFAVAASVPIVLFVLDDLEQCLDPVTRPGRIVTRQKYLRPHAHTRY